MISINLNNIPAPLHFLLPLIQEWGINDDGYREEKIENASIDELKTFLSHFTEDTLQLINDWLLDGNELSKSVHSQEYIAFTNLYMAFEYADIIVKKHFK